MCWDRARQQRVLRAWRGKLTSTAQARLNCADSSVGMQVITVPLHVTDGSAEQSVYMLVGAGGGPDDSPALRLLPDTPAAQAALTATDREIYFWRHNTTNGETTTSTSVSAVSALQRQQQIAHQDAAMQQLREAVRA